MKIGVVGSMHFTEIMVEVRTARIVSRFVCF